MFVRYTIYGHQYEKMIRPNGKCGEVGSYCFLRFTPGDPESIVYMRDLVFPECLNDLSVPDSGWTSLPNCP